jgi:hypothetical protein
MEKLTYDKIKTYRRPKDITLCDIISSFRSDNVNIEFELDTNSLKYKGNELGNYKLESKFSFSTAINAIIVISEKVLEIDNETEPLIFKRELLTTTVVNNLLEKYKLLTNEDKSIKRRLVADDKKLLDIINNKRSSVEINLLNQCEIEALENILDTLNISYTTVSSFTGNVLSINWY